MGEPAAAVCWEGVGKSFAEKLNWERASKGLDGSEREPRLCTCPGHLLADLAKSHSLSEPLLPLPRFAGMDGWGTEMDCCYVRSVPSPARGHSLVRIGQGCHLRLFLV